MEDDSTPILHPTADMRVEVMRVSGKEAVGMRQYNDLVEVKERYAPDDGPEQFLWQGRLWQVREVLSHWMEVGAWWLRRPEEHPGNSALMHEREVWRVTAARGRDVAAPGDPGYGVFDLAFDPSGGVWCLAGAVD